MSSQSSSGLLLVRLEAACNLRATRYFGRGSSAGLFEFRFASPFDQSFPSRPIDKHQVDRSALGRPLRIARRRPCRGKGGSRVRAGGPASAIDRSRDKQVEVHGVSETTKQNQGVGADKQAGQSALGSGAQNGNDLALHNQSAIPLTPTRSCSAAWSRCRSRRD